MKNLILIIVLLIIFATIVLITNARPPQGIEDAQISDVENQDNQDADEVTTSESVNTDLKEKLLNYNPANLNFRFTGFGPGREHTGTFNKITIKNIETSGEMVSSGQIIFFMDSLEVSPEKLKGHLCTDEFFDCPNHPTIKFDLRKVEQIDSSNFKLTGDLTIRGTTKQIAFSLNKKGGEVSADFLVDLRQFGINFPAIEDEARIQFNTTI